GGSPEQGLLSAACAQLGNQFLLPVGTACGMSDSKLPDFQAGAERASTALAAALSGANIVYEAAGMYASLLGACPESLLLDNDVLGAAMRLTRGIEVNEESLGFETIRQVCMDGDGHYLGSDQTISVMQSEYIYPNFSDRTSPNEWEENGKPVLLHSAVMKKNEILRGHFPAHISMEIDEVIRENFPIFLPRESFRPQGHIGPL
ncbi:MAG: methyltransferase, partial [Gammaproteobacteria bacterium]|nr:methyltransferase [Gammaproteobacteria bacterium]